MLSDQYYCITFDCHNIHHHYIIIIIIILLYLQASKEDEAEAAGEADARANNGTRRSILLRDI